MSSVSVSDVLCYFRMNSEQFRVLKMKFLKVMFAALIEELTNMVEKEMTKKKRILTRKWIDDRAVRGGLTLLLKQLRSEYPAEYKLALRLTPENLFRWVVFFDRKLYSASRHNHERGFISKNEARSNIDILSYWLVLSKFEPLVQNFKTFNIIIDTRSVSGNLCSIKAAY